MGCVPIYLIYPFISGSCNMINQFLKVFNCLCEPNQIDWAATGSMIAGVATVALAFIAWYQLGKTNKIANADFAHRFKNDFFTEETRHLFMLFEYELLTLKKESFKSDKPKLAYFEIECTKYDSKSAFLLSLIEMKPRYTSCEIDDLLLGHFEDLGLFLKKGLLDIETIYEGFSYYIKTIHENDQIDNYIMWNREPGGQDIYDNFDYVYKKVRRYGKRKGQKKKLWNRVKGLGLTRGDGARS